MLPVRATTVPGAGPDAGSALGEALLDGDGVAACAWLAEGDPFMPPLAAPPVAAGLEDEPLGAEAVVSGAAFMSESDAEMPTISARMGMLWPPFSSA